MTPETPPVQKTVTLDEARGPERVADLREYLSPASPKLSPRIGSYSHRAIWMFRDLLWPVGIIELVSTGLILAACLLVGELTNLQIALITLGGMLLIPKYTLAFARKRRRDAGRNAYIHALLGRFVNEVFGSPPGCRATWFDNDVIHRNVLVPRVRYAPGESRLSRLWSSRRELLALYYPRGVSFTGLAWAVPSAPLVHEFPPFSGRAEMEKYYEEELHIAPDIIELISNSMVRVRTILCFGIDDPARKDEVLGVLSIDFTGVHSGEFWDRCIQGPLFGTLVDCLSDAALTFSRTPK